MFEGLCHNNSQAKNVSSSVPTKRSSRLALLLSYDYNHRTSPEQRAAWRLQCAASTHSRFICLCHIIFYDFYQEYLYMQLCHSMMTYYLFEGRKEVVSVLVLWFYISIDVYLIFYKISK